jgi:4-hydroxyphenylpyruvate dioxygenase
MADLFENPMGLMGFEFVEFASPTPGVLEPVLETLGFSKVAAAPLEESRAVSPGRHQLHRQQRARRAAAFLRRRARAFGLRDGVPGQGLAQGVCRALELGAQPLEMPTGPMELRLPAIKGIGGAPLYLIDRFDEGRSIYDIDFQFLAGAERHPRGHGFKVIDHLTHNVYRGRMAYWAGFYEKIFNFREIRYFDIKGEYTGLTSRAMTAPDGKIRIPLNEEASRTTGQIEEFLMKYNGEGIQHIALLCDDLIASVDSLRKAGVPLMSAPPATYYQMLEERLPGHGENTAELQARGILVDGSTEKGTRRLLLQIFSQTLLGPVFFEFIQRKGDEGFGEGNFKALFESLERDQIERGVIKAA